MIVFRDFLLEFIYVIYSMNNEKATKLLSGAEQYKHFQALLPLKELDFCC